MRLLSGRSTTQRSLFIAWIVCATARPAQPAPFTWDGGGADDNWGTAANWVGDAAPANDGSDDLTFNGTTRLTPAVDAPWSLSSIVFDDTVAAGAFTIAGSDITFTVAAGVTNNSATDQAINANLITPAGVMNITSATGGLTIGGGVDISAGGGAALSVGGAQDTTISGVISGAGGSLAKQDAGTLTLAGTNTYTGGTTLTGGTLAIGDDAALGTGGLTVGDGTTLHGVGVDRTIANNLTISGDFEVTSDDILDVTGTVDLGGATRVITLNNASGGDAAFIGVVSNGGIDKQGDGFLYLDGDNTYTGGTTLTAGTLGVFHNNALGTGSLTIEDGTTLEPGNGDITITNTVTVNGDFSIAIDTMEPAASLNIASDIALTASRQITVMDNASAELSGVISGAGGLTVAGNSAIAISGANTYTGGTTLSSGTLKIGNDVALGSGVLTVEAGTSLGATGGTHVVNNNVTANGGFSVTGNDDLALMGVISGAGGIDMDGSGTLLLSGVNTYAGGTSLNSGTLAIGDDDALGTGALTIANGTAIEGGGGTGTITNNVTVQGNFGITGSFDLGASGTVDLGGDIRQVTVVDANTTLNLAGVLSNGGVTKAGAGTLQLGGVNTYTGGTTLSAGTLAIGNDAALGTGTFTIANGTTVHGAGMDHEVANAVAVNGDFSITSDDVMDFSGAVDLGGATRVITLNQASGGDAAFIGVVSNGGINKQGDGILILEGNNTYAGGTTLNAGALAVGHDNALGTGGLTIENGGVVVGIGASLNIPNAITVNGNFTIDGDPDPDMGDPPTELLFSGNMDLGAATRIITVHTNFISEAEITGVISNGGLIKDGLTMLILAGDNTYAGGTALNGGTIGLAHDNALGTGALTLAGGTALVALDADRTIANNVTVNGDFNIIGDPNPDMGDPSVSLTLTGGVDLGAADRMITVENSQLTHAELSGVVSNGGIIKAGVGTLILSGTNTYTGNTTINEGTLTLNGGAAIDDTGTVVLADTAGATLALGANETIGSLAGGGAAGGSVSLGANTLTTGDANDTMFAGVASGSGGLTKAGSGTLTLSGVNTYTGGTSLTAGTLAIGDAAALGTGGLTIGNGTVVHGVGMDRIIANAVTVSGDFTITSDDVMDFSGTADLGAATRVITVGSNSDSAFDGVVSNGGVDKQGDGVLIFAGDNTYAGGTTLTAGTLGVGHDNALGTGALTIEDGTTLQPEGDITLANALTVNGDFIVATDPMDPAATLTLTSGITLSATRQISVQDNATAELSGVLSGAGGLTKAGNNGLTLSGTNTYTGTTTVNEGTLTLNGGSAIDDAGAVVLADATGVSLTLGASETIGSLAGGGASGGNVSLGGNTLTVGDASNTTFAGGFAGTGGVVKQGTGSLTIDGASTFDGLITLNAGTLVAGVNSDMMGQVAMSFAGGTFQNSTGDVLDLDGPTTISGDVTLAGAHGIEFASTVDLGGGTRAITVSNTGGLNSTGVISNGGIDKQGTETLKLSGANTYAGGTTLTAGTLEIGSDTALGTGTLTIGDGTAVHGVGMNRIIANNITVSGDFTITSDDVMDFSGTADLGAATRVITVGSNSDSAFDGVVSNGGVDKQGPGVLIFAGDNTYTGGTMLTAGTLGVGHDNALGTGGLTIEDATTLQPEGDITLANTLTVNGDFTIATDPMDPAATLTLTSAIDLSANRQITVTSDADATLSGVISESGGARTLTVAGDQTLTLSGTNTYTGGTALTGGTLLVGDDAALGTGALTVSAATTLGATGGARTLTNAVTANGDFIITGTDNLTLNGVISGTGGFTKQSTGSLTLGGTNTYTGPTTVDAGALTLNGGAAIADTAAVVLGNTAGVSLTLGASETIGTLVGGGASGGNTSLGANTLTVGDASNTAYAGVISGTGDLVKQGTGTLTLAGTNTFTGGVTHNAGTIEVTNNSALGTGGLTLANGATLAANGAAVQLTNQLTIGNAFGFSGTQNLTLTDDLPLGANTSITVSDTGKGVLAGVVSGAFDLTKLGTGTLELTGANTYTGDTNINAGKLLVTGSIDNSTVILGGGQLIIGPNGSVSGNLGVGDGSSLSAGDSDKTINNDLDITGDFNIDGDKNLTLGGNIDLMGAVRQIAVQDAASTATITMPIAGTGGVTKAGNGTLTLSGANTYSGGTAINAGTLVINGSVAGNTNVGGGKLVLGNDNALGTALTLTGGGNLEGSGGPRTIPNTVAVTVNGDFGVTGTDALDIAANVTLGATPTVTTASTGTTTMSGVISGASGISKAGTGTLVLSGTNTYTGDTNINAGTLVLNGIVAGDVIVNAAGAFQGGGTINGDVTVSGIFNAGNSPGVINIGGNMTLTGGSTTVVEIASTISADQYVVTGAANLDGTLQVVQLTGYAPADGDAFTIITAGGGVAGTFATLSASPAALSYNIVYNANDVGITITAIPYTNSATTPNQTAVAAVMDTIRQTAAGDWLTVTTALNALSTAELQNALNQIVPEELGALSNLSFSGTGAQTTNVSNRLAQARNGVGSGAQGLRLANLNTLPEDDLMLLAVNQPWYPPADAFGPAPDQPWNFFATGAGTLGEVDSTSTQAGYDFHTLGLTLGADKKIDDRYIVGVTAGYANSNVDVDSNGGEADVNSFKFGVYASYYDGPFHADAMIGGGYHFYSSDRNIQIGAITRTANSSPDGLELNIAASAGYDFELGSWKVGPTASLQYSRLSIEDYTETGAGALNLSVDRQTPESVLGTVGVRAATMLDYRGVRIIPEVRLSYQHEFEDQARRITARFATGGGGAFGFNTTDIGQDSVLLGLGATFIGDGNWSSFIDYNAELGRKDYVSHSLRGGVRFSF